MTRRGRDSLTTSSSCSTSTSTSPSTGVARASLSPPSASFLLVVVDVVAFSVTRWRITKLAWFFKSWTKRDVFKIVFQYLRYFWSSRAFKISPIWSHWWHTFKYFGSCGGLVSGQRARLLLQTPTKSKTLLQYIIFLPGLDADNFTTYCLVRSNPNQSNNRSVVQWYFHLRSKWKYSLVEP